MITLLVSIWCRVDGLVVGMHGSGYLTTMVMDCSGNFPYMLEQASGYPPGTSHL